MLFRGLDPIQPLAVEIEGRSEAPTADPQTSDDVCLDGPSRPLTWTVVECGLVDFNIVVYWDTGDVERAADAATEHARAFFGSNMNGFLNFVYAGRGAEIEVQRQYDPFEMEMTGPVHDDQPAESTTTVRRVLKMPDDTTLPFFAYGIFRVGQPGFGSIRPNVDRVEEATMAGEIRVRDGMPILVRSGRVPVTGSLLRFHRDGGEDAYRRIAGIEPFKHYRWDRLDIDGEPVNALVGKSPDRGGAEPLMGEAWNGWADPSFVDSLEVVAETLAQISDPTTDDMKPHFRLQAAYLLLWTSIERFIALSYEGGDSIGAGLRHLSSDPAFREAFSLYVRAPRQVSRSDDPSKRERLDPDRPERAIGYYYQVRSNATHRGKAASQDFETLLASTDELLRIFRFVLTAAQLDASWETEHLSPPDWPTKPGKVLDRRDILDALTLDIPGFHWEEPPTFPDSKHPGRRWYLASCGEPAAVQETRPGAPVLPGPHPLASPGSGMCVACDAIRRQ